MAAKAPADPNVSGTYGMEVFGTSGKEPIDVVGIGIGDDEAFLIRIEDHIHGG